MIHCGPSDDHGEDELTHTSGVFRALAEFQFAILVRSAFTLAEVLNCSALKVAGCCTTFGPNLQCGSMDTTHTKQTTF